jgi:hypothetical protein
MTKKRDLQQKGEVLIPEGMKPKRMDISAAWILADHFDAKVEFLRPVNQFMRRTPDFDIDGMRCELKTPESNKPKKIIERIRSGVEQSPIVVVDSRKTKILDKRMIELAQEALNDIRAARKIILITKTKKVLVFDK